MEHSETSRVSRKDGALAICRKGVNSRCMFMLAWHTRSVVFAEIYFSPESVHVLNDEALGVGLGLSSI